MNTGASKYLEAIPRPPVGISGHEMDGGGGRKPKHLLAQDTSSSLVSWRQMYTSLLAPIMGHYSFRKSHHVSAAFICQQETIMGAQTHIVLTLSVNYDPWDMCQPMG